MASAPTRRMGCGGEEGRVRDGRPPSNPQRSWFECQHILLRRGWERKTMYSARYRPSMRGVAPSTLCSTLVPLVPLVP